jgi:hypothetical protein
MAAERFPHRQGMEFLKNSGMPRSSAVGVIADHNSTSLGSLAVAV